MKETYTVVGIGELLWDMFPTGPRLGGAPLNFCYHCRQFGAQGYPVSAIGSDALGTELRSVLSSKEIPNEFVIGYGLDYAQKFRNLNSIYALSE